MITSKTDGFCEGEVVILEPDRNSCKYIIVIGHSGSNPG
jgi:hypothetical protein